MILSFPLLCKLAGSSVIFASVGGAVLAGKKRETERLLRLDSLIALIGFAREQVDRYLTPVSEILRRCDPELLAGCLRGCAGISEKWVPRDMPELVRVLGSGSYAADGRQAMAEFAAVFGRSFREEELHCCDRCAGELIRLRKELAVSLPEKRRSRTVIGVCAAAAAVIILL